MSFTYEQRPSESSLVEVVWRTEDQADGTYLAAADGSWDLIFVTQGKETKVLLSGPSSSATPVYYQKGNRNVGIRFRQGAFMNFAPSNNMLDVTNVIQAVQNRGFYLQGKTWELPTYENADAFVAHLEREGFLNRSDVVMDVLAGKHVHASVRTVQRHFLHATGLSPRYIRLIERANEAVARLQQGEPILDVANELGFSDQAHMTRVVKRVSGSTPGEIVRKVTACRLRSIHNYGPCGEMKVQNFIGGLHEDQTLQN